MKSNLFIGLTLLLVPAAAQQREPIIDMHMHAQAPDSQGPPPLAMCVPASEYPSWDPASRYGDAFFGSMKKPPCSDPIWSPTTDQEMMDRTFAVMERYNIVGVLGGTPERVGTWATANPRRVIRAVSLRVDQKSAPSVATLRALHAKGGLKVLGEVGNQYAGIAPDDSRMEPYWALAEELDVPVGIHLGPGPPGVIYLGSTGYRARMHSALTMEDVLVKHPKLRVYLMHAGYPMLDDLLAVLYAHPQVHVDVGIIVYNQPRAAFYRYLKAIVDAGFTNRVMFGSDQMIWPETIERAIKVMEEAPFLTKDQKRAIFYDNAARFLRLDREEIARHGSY